MDYRNVRRILIELAKRSSINKRVNPHTFRHSRATFMANHLTEFQMNQYFGWIQGSDMPATYVHMSGKEVDNAIFKMNGLQHEDKKESIRKPRVCSRCDSINTFDSAHCRKCGGYLDLKQAMEIEDKKRSVYAQQGLSNDLMTTLLKDKDVQHLLMEKLREIPGISLPF